jgi:hypothetical protein
MLKAAAGRGDRSRVLLSGRNIELVGLRVVALAAERKSAERTSRRPSAIRPFHNRAKRARRRFLSRGSGSARLQVVVDELNDDIAVRRQIVGDAVSGPRHLSCAFQAVRGTRGQRTSRLRRGLLTSKRRYRFEGEHG